MTEKVRFGQTEFRFSESEEDEGYLTLNAIETETGRTQPIITFVQDDWARFVVILPALLAEYTQSKQWR